MENTFSAKASLQNKIDEWIQNELCNEFDFTGYIPENGAELMTEGAFAVLLAMESTTRVAERELETI